MVANGRERRPHVWRGRVRRVALIVGVATGAIFVLLAVASVIEHAVYSGQVLPGVEVDGVDVAGDDDLDAFDAIARLAADLEGTPLRARAAGQPLGVEPSLVGFHVDVDATARAARAAGRRGNPFALAAGTVLRRFRPDRVALTVRYDATRLEGLLDGWANSVNRGLVEGQLRFDGTEVTVVPPRAGTGLLRDTARDRLVAALQRADRSEEVELPVGTVLPKVDRARFEAAAVRARALLAESKEIRADGVRVVLAPAQLATTLGSRIEGNDVELTLDPDKLHAALGPEVTTLEQPAVDASFAITAKNTVTVEPSRDGRALDLRATADAILRGERVITARLRAVHPTRDTAWAQRLGIKRQVSSFTTYHPAGQPRVHNIHLAADVLNNTVVEPGQTFSLNERLGPRTPEKGYVKAPILVEDGYGEDYGGGVSQLATTVFNAVFFGGYVDVDHSPHRFYISRYPMGREATVNYPSVDVKFRNDTAFGVLIRTAYSSTSITVTFYGDNEGRIVREENRRIVNETPVADELIACPAEKPEHDPENDCATLTAFERKVVRLGTPGYDVEFERVIDQPGKPQRRERYRAHYPMLPNRVLVGTTPPTTSVPPTTRPRTTTTKPKTTTTKPPATTTTTT